LVERIRDAAERLENEGGGRPTFFEMTTAMGMLHFSQTKCDVAVIEVGLGGRLDSTNVCQPDVTVITSISFDHQAQLGNTITSIAREKAGIIKPQIPVVCSARHEDARQVVMQQAAAMNAPLHLIDRDFSAIWQRILPGQQTPQDSDPIHSTPTPSDPITNDPITSDPLHVAEIHFTATAPRTAIADGTWRIPILGRHQADNIAAALMAVDLLIESAPPSDQPAVELLTVPALQAAFSTMRLPARLQQVACSPVQIIDTAHNPASIAATLGALEDHFPDQPLTIVFASSRDKEFGEMLKLLLPRCQQLVLTAYQNNPRALAVPELLSAANAIQSELCQQAIDSDKTTMAEIIVADQPLQAWQLALTHASRNSIICGTGSFFLAAELLPLFD
jgi:dihydrofolate synthase/folylpolyglutamate synthase